MEALGKVIYHSKDYYYMMSQNFWKIVKCNNLDFK